SRRRQCRKSRGETARGCCQTRRVGFLPGSGLKEIHRLLSLPETFHCDGLGLGRCQKLIAARAAPGFLAVKLGRGSIGKSRCPRRKPVPCAPSESYLVMRELIRDQGIRNRAPGDRKSTRPNSSH